MNRKWLSKFYNILHWYDLSLMVLCSLAGLQDHEAAEKRGQHDLLWEFVHTVCFNLSWRQTLLGCSQCELQGIKILCTKGWWNV